ncbi:glycosyltransferase [Aliivibrio fischeri]|uniref:glycosyltransferase n=1 Tax=Aliivibrio fischeri TaxID=668 RepID=UPI0012DA261B|nr:glycosyltransferase [Aliivibrio fischeri]MUK65307.1 glycosyltransferase [Aliivibrio fischeri]
MKITLISTSLEVGGGEKQVCDLADQFALKGHFVQLISLTGETILRPKNTNIELVELKAKKTPLSLLKALFVAKRAIKTFGPDVLHSHMVHANIFSRFIKLFMLSKPLVCTAHSTNEGGKLRMLAYRYTDYLCNLNTNVSKEAVNVYLEKRTCPPKKIISMVNGIDVDKYYFDSKFREEKRKELGIKDNEIVIIAVGRLSEPKDYPNLLDAFFALPKNKKRKTKLVIVGAGELEVQLKEKVSFKAECDNILFLGLRSDVELLMSAADIFVMSSAWEGLPLVLLEAMACERAVVATDCGGIKSAVKNNGIVVPIKNSNKLALALEKYIQLSNDERIEIGINARKYVVDNYSLNVVADKWISIYQSLSQ